MSKTVKNLMVKLQSLSEDSIVLVDGYVLQSQIKVLENTDYFAENFVL